MLVVRHKPRAADVIVILGGESRSRVDKAVELYRRGYAPRVLVTGRNEETLIVKRLVASGVPGNAIWLEPAAESTFENARFTAPILRQWNARTVLLVTSWFHSRRAAVVFEGASESIDFLSIPTETATFEQITRDKWLRGYVLMEYVKIAGYWGRYGISPLRNTASALARAREI